MCNMQLDKITLLALTIWFNNCSKSVHKFSEISLLCLSVTGCNVTHALAALR